MLNNHVRRFDEDGFIGCANLEFEGQLTLEMPEFEVKHHRIFQRNELSKRYLNLPIRPMKESVYKPPFAQGVKIWR